MQFDPVIEIPGAPRRVKLAPRERELIALLLAYPWYDESQLAIEMGLKYGYLRKLLCRIYEQLKIRGGRQELVLWGLSNIRAVVLGDWVLISPRFHYIGCPCPESRCVG